MDEQAVIDVTRRWIANMVIGLNLCPFARRVFEADRIHYLVTFTDDEDELLTVLAVEVIRLAGAPVREVETTLLIHPRVLGDFFDYNDFLSAAEQQIAAVGCEGVIQLASFHPDYQFAGTAPGAVENYTNRSPYPLLHLLREDSISAVAGDPDELLAIPRRNIETLRRLGKEAIREKLRAIAGGPGRPA